MIEVHVGAAMCARSVTVPLALLRSTYETLFTGAVSTVTGLIPIPFPQQSQNRLGGWSLRQTRQPLIQQKVLQFRRVYFARRENSTMVCPLDPSSVSNASRASVQETSVRNSKSQSTPGGALMEVPNLSHYPSCGVDYSIPATTP